MISEVLAKLYSVSRQTARYQKDGHHTWLIRPRRSRTMPVSMKIPNRRKARAPSARFRRFPVPAAHSRVKSCNAPPLESPVLFTAAETTRLRSPTKATSPPNFCRFRARPAKCPARSETRNPGSHQQRRERRVQPEAFRIPRCLRRYLAHRQRHRKGATHRPLVQGSDRSRCYNGLPGTPETTLRARHRTSLHAKKNSYTAGVRSFCETFPTSAQTRSRLPLQILPICSSP